jgi:hypothetical protein
MIDWQSQVWRLSSKGFRGGIEENPSTAHHTRTQQNCMVLLRFNKYRQSSRFCQRNLASQMMRLTTLCALLMIEQSTGLRFVGVTA